MVTKSLLISQILKGLKTIKIKDTKAPRKILIPMLSLDGGTKGILSLERSIKIQVVFIVVKGQCSLKPDLSSQYIPH